MSLSLSTFRSDLATYLRDNLADDVTVIDHIPDSIAPPAVVFAWRSPWLTPDTSCFFVAAGELIIVSQRIEPGGHLEVLEQLTEQIFLLLRARKTVIRDAAAPFPISLGGVDYLASAINFTEYLGE